MEPAVARGARLDQADPPSMMATSCIPVVIVDDGHAGTVEGLAMAVAVYGHGRFDLLHVGDWAAARSAAAHLAAGVVGASPGYWDRYSARRPRSSWPAMAPMGSEQCPGPGGRDGGRPPPRGPGGHRGH